MRGKKLMRALYRELTGRLQKHPKWILCLSGGAVAFVYLLMASGIREQQINPSRLKTSAEYAEAVQMINLALVRKTLAADGVADDSDEIIGIGLNQLENADVERDKTFEVLLNDYIAGVKKLQKIPAGQLSGNDPKMRKLLDAASPQLVREIRRASLNYQHKSESMLGDTAMQQHWMFAVSLGSLLVIGLLLLQPLLKQLQESAMRSRQEKRLADKVIDTAQVHIFGLDTEGRVVLMNRHAEQHSGWLGEEVKGGNFAEYFMPADRRHELQTVFGDMLAGEPEAARQIEIPLVTSSGEKIPMAWNLALVEDSASGKPGMILLIGAERLEREQRVHAPAANLLQFNSRSPESVFVSDDEEMDSGVVVGRRATDNIIRISDNLYRRNERRVVQPAKEAIAFFTEDGYSGFPGHFDQDRICRILPRHNDFCNKLGWNRLLNQHNESLDDDLYALMPGKSEYRHFDLKHTDDETSVTEAVYGWLRDEHNLPSDVIDAVLTVLDEMIENSLYSAPRDSNGLPYYPKGESRDLASYEQISVDVARGNDILGLMITDYWGTLTPSVFFRSLSRAMESGIESMESGVGLYMIWRLSDYLQIRVHPNKCTQLTVLWDVSNGFVDHNVDAGLQFLYHNDYEAPYQMRASI